MHRPRTFLNTATVLSLALGTASIALWAYSYHVRPELNVTRADGREWSFRCDPGGCYLESTIRSARFDPHPPQYENGWRFHSFVPEPKWLGFQSRQILGFGTGRSAFVATPGGITDAEYRTQSTVVRIPLYALVAVTALPLLAQIRARRAALRDRIANRCPNCGYDLRATPDRCPECGTIQKR